MLDIDETSLSNYSAIDGDNFTFGTNRLGAVANETGVAIRPTLDLYNLAKAKGIALFFISERRESARDHTTSNLLREGYSGWSEPSQPCVQAERRDCIGHIAVTIGAVGPQGGPVRLTAPSCSPGCGWR